MEECLSGIKDERRQSGHFPHKLIDVPVIGLTTIRAGWDEYTVAEHKHRRENDSRIRLQGPECRAHRQRAGKRGECGAGPSEGRGKK
jgi:hypothetical protein